MSTAPTSPPLNLSLVASTSTSVTLSWAPPPTQYQNGVIMGYTLQVFNSQQGLLRETNTSSNGSTVDSLRPNTTYLLKVAAMTDVGRGPYSDNMYVATRQFGRLELQVKLINITTIVLYSYDSTSDSSECLYSCSLKRRNHFVVMGTYHT